MTSQCLQADSPTTFLMVYTSCYTYGTSSTLEGTIVVAKSLGDRVSGSNSVLPDTLHLQE